MTALTERAALLDDARLRIQELEQVARVLWPDRDDSMVLCELHAVVSQLKVARATLADLEAIVDA